LKYYYPAILWGIFIIIVSTIGGVNLPESFWDFIAMDKVAHFGVYAVFVILLNWGLEMNCHFLNSKILFWSIGTAIFLGILMEIVQYSFFPNRYFEFIDIIANIIGAFVGSIVYKRFFL